MIKTKNDLFIVSIDSSKYKEKRQRSIQNEIIHKNHKNVNLQELLF